MAALTGGTLLPPPSPIPPLLPPRNVCTPHSSMFEDIWLDSSSDDDTDSDWEYVDTPHTAEDNSYHARATVSERDDESDNDSQLAPRVKPGGYDSRVEQILYEKPDLPILITDAGKSLESGGRYIVYTIRTGVRKYPICLGHNPGLWLTRKKITRISRFAAGIPNSRPSAMRSAVYTLLSSSRPSPRNTPWPTTPRTRPMPNKTNRLLTCESACWPCS